MKPIIFYVDDEPHNLTVFEASLPEDWEIFTFDDPLMALEAIESHQPWVVVSDQRMPSMVGVRFLELVKKISPLSKRVLTTGYSEEDLVVESVRKAQVCDYIRKPWDIDDLEIRLQKIIESFLMERELHEKQIEIEAQCKSLKEKALQLEKVQERESRVKTELESWVPPFVLQFIEDNQSFPLRRDLAVITFDLINSGYLHDLFVGDRSARSLVLKHFSELIIRHGGWRESHSGDSAYGHFGLLKNVENPCDAALAVATEFRVFLRNFSQSNQFEMECGIGLHLAKECLVDVHEVKFPVSHGILVQKSFDTTSSDIDLVHRMEKCVHELDGTNIIMSKEFVDHLTSPPFDLVDVGSRLFKGQSEVTRMFVKKSDRVTAEMIDEFKESEDEVVKTA